MKKNTQTRSMRLFLPVLVFALTFMSCEDFLDVEPPSGVIIEEVAFETFDDVESALFGAYRFSTYTWFVVAYNAWAADNAQRSRDNGGIGTIYFNWTYNSSNSLETEAIYLRCYRQILSVNKIFENIDAVEGGSDADRNRVLAQCYALRAMAHFDLARLFAARYASGSGQLGIPVVLESADAASLPAQNTVAEVYAAAKADLQAAGNLFADYTISDPTFFSNVAVDAMLQRIALYEEDWAEVISIGQRIMNNSGLVLQSGSAYADMFNTVEAPGEFIFKVGLPAGTNFSIPGISGTQNMGDIFAFGTSVNNYIPNAEFAASFDPSDIRPSVMFVNRPGSPTLDKDFVIKYEGVGSTGTTDQPVLRLSEVYLSMAEAYFNMGMTGEARDMMDAVRAARIDGYTSVGETGNALRDAIREERRKELAYEGHRFFDLARWGLGVERGSSCTALSTGSCSLPADDHRYILPFPQHEMNVNPNMIQNPGY